VKYFEEDGLALREEFDFPVLGKVLVCPYSHPEQVTLPKYIKCRQVTNKGTQLPEEYAAMIRDMARLGLASKEPLVVGGHKITPWDFSVSYIIRERDRILEETNFGAQRGCASVVVKGKKDGIKLLGHGEIKHSLEVQVNQVSKSAREKIEAAGGKVEVL